MESSTFGRFLHSPIAGSKESANSSILPACNLFAGSLESVNLSILPAGRFWWGKKQDFITVVTAR